MGGGGGEGRSGRERGGREGGKGVGRREGGITIIESSLHHITSKAIATLKVAKLCNFHFHNLSQFPGLCLTMARVHDDVISPQLKLCAFDLVEAADK